MANVYLGARCVPRTSCGCCEYLRDKKDLVCTLVVIIA